MEILRVHGSLPVLRKRGSKSQRYTLTPHSYRSHIQARKDFEPDPTNRPVCGSHEGMDEFFTRLNVWEAQEHDKREAYQRAHITTGHPLQNYLRTRVNFSTLFADLSLNWDNAGYRGVEVTPFSITFLFSVYDDATAWRTHQERDVSIMLTQFPHWMSEYTLRILSHLKRKPEPDDTWERRTLLTLLRGVK